MAFTRSSHRRVFGVSNDAFEVLTEEESYGIRSVHALSVREREETEVL
jgi:hypothetical protein